MRLKKIINNMGNELFDINEVNEQFYNDAVELLGKYDYTLCESIVSFVSALFKIDKDEIFKHNACRRYTIPRWLCWCAFSEFTNQSHDEIAHNFSKDGDIFSPSAISRGIIAIRNTIEIDPVVRSKWQMIKKFLKANEKSVPTEERITIIVPVGMKRRIDIKEARI